MTDTAHASTALWCMAYEISIPEGYEVAGFNETVTDHTLLLGSDGEVFAKCRGCHYTGPILKKIAPCEHKSVWTDHENDMVICKDCSMVRILGDWE